MREFELVRLQFHEIEASPGFAGWLAAEGVSVGFTCGSQLFLVGLSPDGALLATDRQYGLCAALHSSGPDTLWLASRFQIWRLENALPEGTVTDEGHDRLYVPQTAWTTGLLGVHDLGIDGDGAPVFVNARLSCLCRLSDRYNFEPVWVPPFISVLAPEDRCHLTGLAIDGGRPAYVTCAAATDTADGWREHQSSGGVVVRVADGELVARGLSMPHSPRLRDGRLWLANGGTGEVGFVDLGLGLGLGGEQFEAVAAVPGFCRGLVLRGRHALVGCSKAPKDGTFDGLPVERRLEQSGVAAACGLFVVDLETGAVEHSMVLHGGPPEIQDVAVLPGVRSAGAVAIQGDDVQDLVTIPCLGE